MRRACLALLLVVGCAACQSAGVVLPRLPEWPTAKPSAVVSGIALAQAAKALVPEAEISWSDGRYTVVPHQWLDRYLNWTWQAAKIGGVEYRAETFDCEDFTLGFYFFATRAAARAGLTASPLIARVVVSGGAEGLHELIGVATDAGHYIVEPQPDAGPFRFWPLAEYRRTHRIHSIVFGDLGPNRL